MNYDEETKESDFSEDPTDPELGGDFDPLDDDTLVDEEDNTY